MLTKKRIALATDCGIVFGFVCMWLASSNPDPNYVLSPAAKYTIVLSRALMGFTIGVSALRMKWWLHGMFIGAIATIPMLFMVMDRPIIMAGTLMMGVIYGFLTELITSIIFRFKQPWLNMPETPQEVPISAH